MTTPHARINVNPDISFSFFLISIYIIIAVINPNNPIKILLSIIYFLYFSFTIVFTSLLLSLLKTPKQPLCNLQKFQEQIENAKKELEILKGKAEELSGDAKAELEEKSKLLEAKLEEAEDKWDEIKDLAEDKLDDLKSDLSKFWDSAKSKLDDLF